MVITGLSSWESGRKHLCGKRTLLVDDEESVRDSVRLLLEELWEHSVVEASGGMEALERFKPGRFDLVVTDSYMPTMPGNELAKRIKELAPDQPVLMITGFPQNLSGRENPVDFVLTKPFTLPELRMALERLLVPAAVPQGVQ